MRKVTEFMKAFEQASKFVTVDIDYATKTYETMIDDGTATVMVLEKEGDLIGSLGFIEAPDLHNGNLMLIETFWFTDSGKRGYGLLLLDAYEKYAHDNGIKKIAMIHMMDSYPERLEVLYLKRGYRLMEKHYIKEI